MFNRLIELVGVVSKNKVQRIEIIGEETNYDTLVHQLYKGIQEGRFETAEAAAAALYNSTPENKNFKHLQYMLEKRLLNTVFFIDVNRPSYTDISKAYYTCQKNMAAVKILRGRVASLNAISLAERTIRQAIKFEFSDVVISLARHLKAVYSRQNNGHKKHRYYSDILTRYLELFQAEIYAEDCYQKIIMYHTNSGVVNKNALKDAIKFSRKLEQMLKKHESYEFNLNAYLTIILRYDIEQKYDKIIKICHQAINYFESDTKRKSSILVSHFQRRISVNYTIIGDYKKAEEAIQKCLPYISVDGNNWFYTMEYYMMLCFQSGQYQKAYHLLLEVQANKKYLQHHKLETWQVYAAYVHYFIRIERIKLNAPEQEQLREFRYYKFLNSVPVFSKDKKGVNIAILILQILLLLEAKKYDVVIERTDALNQYSYKYLKKGDSYRSHCFIRMLIKLIEAQFHKAGAMRKANTYLGKLKAHPMELSLQTSEVEIVPYEDLWEFALNTVDNKFIKIKKD